MPFMTALGRVYESTPMRQPQEVHRPHRQARHRLRDLYSCYHLYVSLWARQANVVSAPATHLLWLLAFSFIVTRRGQEVPGGVWDMSRRCCRLAIWST